MDINVILVNYKMKLEIEKCLTSLFADFAGDSLNVGVTVVDNNSKDGIGEMLAERFPKVKFIAEENNLGFGKANNVALKNGDAKYFFVLNPDTIFLPNQHTLKKLYDFMESNSKIGIAGPKIIYPDGSLQYSCYRFPTFWQPFFSRTNLGTKGPGRKANDRALMKDFDHNTTQPVDWLMGSAMFVRGEALLEVGVFDDRFWMYYEDSDWCRRMWEKGWPVYYLHDIVIQHSHSRGSAKIPGIFLALLKNNLARTHFVSWLKYMWKWRGNYKFYSVRK